MAYPTLDQYNFTNDITLLFVYANDVTQGKFMALVLFAFFMIVLLSSFFAQKRIGGGNIDFSVSFAAAGFVTAGLSYILLIKDGLLNPLYSIVATVVAIIGVVWLYFSRRE